MLTDVPPALKNGSGKPVVGRMPVNNAHVDKRLKPNHGRDARAEQTAKPVAAVQRNTKPCKHKQDEQRNHRQAAHQSKVLADNGKDKIGFRIRQIGKLLSALPQPHAKQAARPQRNKRCES